MPVALFYLAKPRTGGWLTYTAHLAKGFNGDVTLFRIGKRDEKQKREFGRGLQYQNISLEHAIAIAQIFPSLITATDKHYQEAAETLVTEAKIPAVVHDPTELKLAHISKLEKMFVIRETMLAHLPKATYIPHPYMRCPDLTPSQRKENAVAISRIDYDKRTHLIAEANKLGANITIYGTENRLYTHHKLNKEHPEWREMYRGSFPVDDLWAGTRICSQYKNMIDMSVISGDGGGTQYTFLEALDAGTGLILHDEWKPSGKLKNICETVGSAEELRLATKDTNFHKKEANSLLQEHDAIKIAQEYLEKI